MSLISSWCLSIYKLKTVSSGRASPSTREAIAGMLSFSEQCYSTTSNPSKSSRSKTQRNDDDNDDDDQSIENIDKVHQDDDFSTYIQEYLILSFLTTKLPRFHCLQFTQLWTLLTRKITSSNLKRRVRLMRRGIQKREWALFYQKRIVRRGRARKRHPSRRVWKRPRRSERNNR